VLVRLAIDLLARAPAATPGVENSWIENSWINDPVRRAGMALENRNDLRRQHDKAEGTQTHATTAKPRAPTLLPHCAIILQLVARLFGKIVIFYEIM